MTFSASRREFFVRSGGVTAITTAINSLGAVHSEATGPEEKIQLGLIGCGA